MPDTAALPAGPAAPDPADTPEEWGMKDFLAAHGGPFYELQERLNLLHRTALRSGRRAAIFVGLAWGVPLLLGLPGSTSLAGGSRSFLGDPGVWARFFVAVGAFVLADEQVERGLRRMLGQFVRAPLIPPASIPQAAADVNAALRRRDSPLAEAVCLALGYALAVNSFYQLRHAPVSTWAVTIAPDGAQITLAGWWTILVSLPLFAFLMLRGLWRHLVWSLLLRRFARLPLRLVATHPDGKGGLGFIGRYPNAYTLFVLGIGSAIGVTVTRHMTQNEMTVTTFSMIMGGWLALAILMFAYPLSAFSPPLLKMRETGLLLLGAQATRFHRAAERKLMGRNVVEEEEAPDDGDVLDPTKQFDTTRKLSTLLITRHALIPVSAAALLPFAVAGATKLPYKEVWSIMKKLLLL